MSGPVLYQPRLYYARVYETSQGFVLGNFQNECEQTTIPRPHHYPTLMTLISI